MFDWVITK
jgi:hypothetical protein